MLNMSKEPTKFKQSQNNLGIVTPVIKEVADTVYFYSEVNTATCCELNKLLRDLDAKQQTLSTTLTGAYDPVVHLRICSYGGDVFAALATIDTIRTMKSKVYTYVEGAAASAGTLMSVVANKRFIGKNSMMLIHQIRSIHAGTFEDLEDCMENSKKIMNLIKGIYKQYSKVPMKDIDNILKRDIWWDSETCLKMGLVDGIV